jgi:hypothetical protein
MKHSKRNKKTSYVLRVQKEMGEKFYLLKKEYATLLDARNAKIQKLKNYYQIFVEFKRKTDD